MRAVYDSLTVNSTVRSHDVEVDMQLQPSSESVNNTYLTQEYKALAGTKVCQTYVFSYTNDILTGKVVY